MSTDEKTKQFYKDNADKYVAHVRNPQDSVYHAYYEKPAMYALLPDLRDKVVLSIGCGSSEDSNYLKKQGAKKSVGIDLTSELITIATNSYPECEFQLMDMEKLDFPDGSFDFVYSSLAIHYVEDWGKVFKEVYRILKPSSYFLFSCGHPLRFAMDNADNQESKILKLELSKSRSTEKVSITGDYLAKRKIIDALGENTANVWTMPISDIVKDLTDAGFKIEQIVEPRPMEEMKEIQPESYYRLSKIPEFIIFKVIK